MSLPHSGPECQGGRSVAANHRLLNSVLTRWLPRVVTTEVPNDATTAPAETTIRLGAAAGLAVLSHSVQAAHLIRAGGDGANSSGLPCPVHCAP